MDKTRQSAVVALLAVVAVAAAGWFLLISPQRSHAASLRQQAAQAEQNNATLATQVAEHRAQEKQLPQKEALLAQLQSRIPADPELPSLIRELSSAADSAGVQLVSLSPATPSTVTQTAAPAPSPGSAGRSATPAAPAIPANSLADISVQMNVVGGYFNLEQFFSNLESLPRALRVTQFSINAGATTAAASPAPPASSSPQPVAPGTALTGQETATITALVFMNTTPTGTAAPAASH
jgi:Tfp pilus assembly protein PilO